MIVQQIQVPVAKTYSQNLIAETHRVEKDRYLRQDIFEPTYTRS